MTWDISVVFGNIAMAFILLWVGFKFRKETEENPENPDEGKDWFRFVIFYLFVFLGLYALMAAGGTTLAVIDITNATGGFSDTMNLTSAQYTLIESGSLGMYKILYYGTRTFFLLFMIYIIYYSLTLVNAFIDERRAKNKKKEGFDGEEPR